VKRVLIFISMMLFLISGVQAQDSKIAGEVYSKTITEDFFRAEHRLLRGQLSSRMSARDLWQRLAFLERARQLNIKVERELLLGEIAKLVRRHIVSHDARQGIQGALSLPANRVLYEKRVKALAKSFVFNAEVFKRFIGMRKISQASFERIILENLTIKSLLAQQSAGWDSKGRAQKTKQRLAGRCVVEVLEFHADDYLLGLRTASEEELKLFYRTNRFLYRRPRHLKLQAITRADDGSLAVLSQLKRRWQALIQQRQAIPWQQWIEKEDIESTMETSLGSWQDLVIPPVFNQDFKDIIQKLRIGEVSHPLRAGGQQFLISLLVHESPRQLQYDDMGGAAPDGLLFRDWLRFQSLNSLLSRAHAIRRQLDKKGWTLASLEPYRKKLTRPGSFNQNYRVRFRQYPHFLFRKALRLNTGESMIISDIQKRRLLIVHMIERSRPASESLIVTEEEIKKAEKKLALSWKTQLFLESKGIKGPVQDYAKLLLSPRHRKVIRQLIVLKPQKAEVLKELKRQFNQGSSLNLLALRSAHAKAQTLSFYQSSNLARAAEFVEPYEIAGPFPAAGYVHILMTEPLSNSGNNKVLRRRVFHIAYKINNNFKFASDRANVLIKKLEKIEPKSWRLKSFRLFARKLSEAPTANVGGYIGQIQLEQSALIQACKRQLTLLEPGERCHFTTRDALVFLTVLDALPLKEEDQRSFDQLFEMALPWTDQRTD
jgi:hypothetical protein